MADDIHALAGPYVLGALATEAEREAFESHLAHCDLCAEEVGGLLATSAVLGRAVALPPPSGLRGRVLDEIVRTPQEAAGRPAKDRRRFPRPATLLAAACLVVAVASGAVAVRTQQRLDHETTRTQAIAAVLSAPDARTVTGRTPSGGMLTAVASPVRGSAVVTSSGLPALPSARTYELWAIGGRGARPAGLVRPDPGGRIAPVVASVPAGYDRIGLTVEPAGGSPQPTTTPLALLSIRRA
jgi:anti-sigma-K factor RskA